MRKKLLTTDSTLCGYIIMPVVCTLYGYQDSALNHMVCSFILMCIFVMLNVSKNTLDRWVDRVKPWFMGHGLAHGS